MREYHEPGRKIPAPYEADVVVCGGGPAGCAAAIAAARHGARTLLLEADGWLGGATTDQLITSVLTTNGVDCQGIWHEFIDIYAAEKYQGWSVPRHAPEYQAHIEKMKRGDFYDIRYGALVAADVDNLLVAGRCISADHVAQSSLRIQQTCMATDQAAGTAAVLSLKAGCTPRELPAAVVEQLERDRATVEPAFECLRDLPLAPMPPVNDSDGH